MVTVAKLRKRVSLADWPDLPLKIKRSGWTGLNKQRWESLGTSGGRMLILANVVQQFILPRALLTLIYVIFTTQETRGGKSSSPYRRETKTQRN